MSLIPAEGDSLLLETSGTDFSDRQVRDIVSWLIFAIFLSLATGGMQAVLTRLEEHERDSLSLGFGGKSLTSKSKIHELLAGYAAILAGEDDQNAYRAEGVFLGRDMMAASASGPQYMVLFERICSRLKRQLLESFVEETQGPLGRRVFNAVMHGDKVTEEMVSPSMSIRSLRLLILPFPLAGRFESAHQGRRGSNKAERTQDRLPSHFPGHLARSRPVGISLHLSLLCGSLPSVSDHPQSDVQVAGQHSPEKGNDLPRKRLCLRD